jgi:DHA1 family multidrug resistance protein-like MFS transporter
MQSIVRDTAFGQIVRLMTRNQFFQYPEENPGFMLPPQYSNDRPSKYTSAASTRSVSLHSAGASKQPYLDSESGNMISYQDKQEQLELAKTESQPVIPKRTAEGVILVDWYTTDDSENPQNWPSIIKLMVVLLTCTYTWVVYTASTIIAPSQEGIMEQFGVTATVASLTLALFVLAYGVGPLIFGPLSEIPVFGRNWIYISTFWIFFVLSFPTAVVQNFAGLLVLRFLTGFFASPALANAGATFSDMYSLVYLPYYLSWWTWAAWAGPALGFTLSGFAVTAENWRWSLWEIVWMAAPVAILLVLFLPETSTANILLRRAKRLRKLTKNQHLQSQSEIDRRGLTPSAVAVNALIKPIEIMVKDPSILFIHAYTGLFYGIYYSFFECLPLVMSRDYGFNLGETGLAFLACGIGASIGQCIYFAYLKRYMIPDNLKNGLREQEHRLVPGVIAAWLLPIGLFLFAWTARSNIHWIVPLIGVVIFVIGFFIEMQVLFVYLPLSYPKYAASLFTANDLLRSSNAFASLLYSRPLFLNLGIGKGVSVLAGLTVAGAVGMIWLYYFGKRLRALSTFAEG